MSRDEYSTGHDGSRYSHLMSDFEVRPLTIARHLREAHGLEPKAARLRYEREVWHSQHEHEGHAQ